MKVFLIFFALLIDLTSCVIHPEPDLKFERMIIIKNIISKCLVGKESITIFAMETSRNFSKQQNKMYQIIELVKPVYVFNSIDETLAEKINDMGNELEVPSTTKSYFVMSENISSLSRNLKLFSRVNTNGQWIFFLMNFQMIEVHNLLKTAYKNYRMLNLLIVFFDLESLMYVATYNPFKINKNSHGEVFSLQVNLENLQQIVQNVDNFFDKKVGNLQGYPLNVSYYSELSVLNTFLDFEMFEVFQRKLNCTFNYVQTRDSAFGLRLPNGTLTG